jgi:hypothetical protein
MNKALKTTLALSLIMIVSLIQFGITNAVIDGLESANMWAGMLMDSLSWTLPYICFGLYTKLPFQTAQILSSMPFLCMIFFSTTFSPGGGSFLKVFRFLFPRFYFWCMLPGVGEQMEGCPESHALNIAYMVLAGFLNLFIFFALMAISFMTRTKKTNKANNKKELLKKDDEYRALQVELFGGSLQTTSHSSGSNTNKQPIAGRV